MPAGAAALAVAAALCGAAQADEPPAAVLARLDAIGRRIAAERCARPLEVKTSFVRNPQHREVADEMQSIDCRGFRIALYRSLAPSPP